jgi:hypothetical protein
VVDDDELPVGEAAVPELGAGVAWRIEVPVELVNNGCPGPL